MSYATLYVRFPDGEVRYGIYHATVDIARPRLYATAGEAWDDMGARWPWAPPKGVRQPVEVATDYGNGATWPGRATRDRLFKGLAPYDDDTCQVTDGLPEWAV